MLFNYYIYNKQHGFKEGKSTYLEKAKRRNGISTSLSELRTTIKINNIIITCLTFQIIKHTKD